MVPVFKDVDERSTAKNYHPDSLLSVVNKVFEKLVNNRTVDHLEKCGLLSDFQYGFRVWHAGLLHKLKSYGISGQMFDLISSFLSNRHLRVVLDGKSSQEYPVNAEVPQRSILGPALFLLYTNDLPDDVICNIAINANDTTFYSKCDQASDLWQQTLIGF